MHVSIPIAGNERLSHAHDDRSIKRPGDDHTRLESIDAKDVHRQLEIEKDDASELPQSPASDEPEDKDKEIISFHHDDPENPNNWASGKKIRVVLLGIVLVLNSTIGSSIPSGTVDRVSQDFDNYNQAQQVLPISIYLVGYVLGPLAFGPLSETYGRKVVMISTFSLYTAFTLGCALAPTFAAYIVFRFFMGVGASAPISVVGGIYADVYDNPITRGRALTIFMACTTWGPLISPVVSGFTAAALGWRWVYWIALMLAGISWPVLLFSPETYGPVILKRRAQRLRKETGNPNIFAAAELENQGIGDLITVVLTRPLRMFLFEALVLCSCLYLSLVYAIFYMFFEAFPIIYISGSASAAKYQFNYGEQGLAFLPIGIGAALACGIYLWWDHHLEQAKKRNVPWTAKEEYRRLPLACLGGPLFAISLFWVGWTARPDVHWIVPILGSLPFGVGYMLLFMALFNYLVDAYEVFAASASAAAACTRSFSGAILPFAAKPMYQRLGVPGACSLLGGLSLLMCVIPFAFIKYGDRIRENSKFCQQLKKQKADLEVKLEKERQADLKKNGTVEQHESEQVTKMA